MTAQTAETTAELFCDHCGYDLRAHPPDGKCPECGTSVAESRRLAANPRRPAWQKSDPRWRRRILIGVWLLVLVPLMDVLTASGLASHVPVPNVFHFPGSLRLDETFFCTRHVYTGIVFCCGVVLLFSKERGRRYNRMDWTRRWGVICTYIVSLLCVVPITVIIALVLAGIAALFLAMPPRYQPGVTQFFVSISTAWLRHGPYPKEFSGVVLVAFSSITILLACVPLFNALRSTAAKNYAFIPLVPLALFALMHLAQACQTCFSFAKGTSSPWAIVVMPLDNIDQYALFFWPELLAGKIFGFPAYSSLVATSLREFFTELVKWSAMLGIAIWLSIAQIAAWWRRKKVSADLTPPAAGTA